MKLRELERTHRRRLAACFLLIVVTGVVFLSYAVVTLFQDRASEDDYWEKSFTETDSLNQELAQRSRSAVPVCSIAIPSGMTPAIITKMRTSISR